VSQCVCFFFPKSLAAGENKLARLAGSMWVRCGVFFLAKFYVRLLKTSIFEYHQNWF